MGGEKRKVILASPLVSPYIMPSPPAECDFARTSECHLQLKGFLQPPSAGDHARDVTMAVEGSGGGTLSRDLFDMTL